LNLLAGLKENRDARLIGINAPAGRGA